MLKNQDHHHCTEPLHQNASVVFLGGLGYHIPANEVSSSNTAPHGATKSATLTPWCANSSVTAHLDRISTIIFTSHYKMVTLMILNNHDCGIVVHQNGNG